jgi:hypothetical protein
MGTTESAGIFIAPAWWDPQARRVIVHKKSVVAGVLVSYAGNITFVGPADVVFDLRRGEADVDFLRMSAAFDLRAAGTEYRIYLRPPVSGVPILDKDQLMAVGLGLTRTVTVVDWAADNLNKPAGDAGELGTIAGNIVRLVSADLAGALGKDRCAALRAAWSVDDPA